MVGLGCSSLPVADHSAPLHPGTIPVNHVVWLIGMDCDAVVRVPMHHCRLVVAKSHLERPLGLPDVGLMTFFTRDPVDNSSLPLLQNAGLDLHQGLPEDPRWLDNCLDPKGSAKGNYGAPGHPGRPGRTGPQGPAGKPTLHSPPGAPGNIIHRHIMNPLHRRQFPLEATGGIAVAENTGAVNWMEHGR